MSRSHAGCRGSDEILVRVWLLLQSIQLSCIVWYSVITPVKTVGLSQHTSWIKKKALWNNRRAPCPFLFSSTHSIFSRIFILGERRHHKRFCWSQRSPAKGWRQKNRINIHHPVAGCQRLERKKSEAINLLSWTWCVGYLTRMFSAFNYSPKSPSPTRIKSYFKVKWRRCRDRGHAADNGHRRLQQERLFFFRRAHQSGTRRSFLVCRPQ